MARRTNRQHPGGIARRADRAVLRLTQPVLAEVPGGRHHDDPGVHGALGRERQRIGLVRLGHRSANRQVDHAEVEGRLVDDGPVERRDHVADDAAPVLIENLQAHDVRIGRDASTSTQGVEAVAGDDPRDVRAVTAVVVRRRPPVDEINKRGNALAVLRPHERRRPEIRQVCMP